MTRLQVSLTALLLVGLSIAPALADCILTKDGTNCSQTAQVYEISPDGSIASATGNSEVTADYLATHTVIVPAGWTIRSFDGGKRFEISRAATFVTDDTPAIPARP
jgi:hypothetical protein